MDILDIESLQYLRRWVPISILIGLVSGSAALALYYGIKAFTAILSALTGMALPEPPSEGEPLFTYPSNPVALVFAMALAGLASGVLTYGLAPEAEGHGTDAAIRAFHRERGVIRAVVPPVKLAASAVTIGFGGSAGREGPIALTAAGFGSVLSRLLKLPEKERRIALAAGIGAGIGAIFKAPIGGAILAAEILYLRDLEVEVIIPAIVASITGYILFASVTGWSHIFAFPDPYTFDNPAALLYYAVLGLVAGLVGILYTRAFYWSVAAFRRLRVPNHVKPMIGMALTGLLGLAFPQVLGMGYGWVQMAINGEYDIWEIAFLIALAKIAATSLTVGSGASGGVFAPSLFIGAMLGAAMWGIFSGMPYFSEPVSALVVVGMTAFFAGVGKAPISTLIMVSEMTGAYTLLPPAITAVAVSYVVTGRYTIYESKVQARHLSPAHRGEYSAVLEWVKVGEVMRREVLYVHPSDTLTVAAQLMSRHGIRGLPVVDAGGRVVGIVTTSDLVKVPGDMRGNVTVGEVMTKRVVVALPEETLEEALRKMLSHEIGRLPVVNNYAERRLVGIITRGDIWRKYFELIGE